MLLSRRIMSRPLSSMVVLDAGTMAVDPKAWKSFERFGSLTLHDTTRVDEVLDRSKSANILLTNKVVLNKEIINSLPNLQMIAVMATGVNIIDSSAARERGISVCNVPTYGTDSTAQHTVALMMELANRVGLHDNAVQAGDWIDSKYFYFMRRPMFEFRNATIGFVGMGHIGRRVAEMLRGFGCKEMIAYTPSRRQAPDVPNFRWVELDELFRESDILTLHAPLTVETHHIVNKARLKTMKPGAMIVNTSRGPLIDEQALADAARNGQVSAAVDVLQLEPMSKDSVSPLLGVENIIITPHIAWSSEQSRLRLLKVLEENIEGFLDGKSVNVVN